MLSCGIARLGEQTELPLAYCERLLQLAKAVERRLWWFQHPVRQLAELAPNLHARRRKFPADALRQLEAKRLFDRI